MNKTIFMLIDKDKKTTISFNKKGKFKLKFKNTHIKIKLKKFDKTLTILQDIEYISPDEFILIYEKYKDITKKNIECDHLNSHYKELKSKQSQNSNTEVVVYSKKILFFKITKKKCYEETEINQKETE